MVCLRNKEEDPNEKKTSDILEAILGAIVSLAVYKALKPILKS